MMKQLLSVAFAFVLGTGALAVTSDARAEALFGKKGCSAECSKGSCSTSNSAHSCGCCSDGTPYCGSASDCTAHATTSLTMWVRDLAVLGGVASADSLRDSLLASLDGSAESMEFVVAVEWFATAVLADNADEIEMARDHLNESYSLLGEGQDLLALRAVLEGMLSPAQ